MPFPRCGLPSILPKCQRSVVLARALRVISPPRTMPLGARYLKSLLRATCVVMIMFGVNVGRSADIGTGSGVVIGTHGEVLTNSHVVENCTQITVRSSSASVVARDEKNDLAVVHSTLPT